jgi:poly(glycerol-phosphate) alpha-glucosyltransferase
LNIAFLTPSLSRTSGGIFEIERRLAQSLLELPDTQLEVFGAHDHFTEADAPLWLPLRPESFPFRGPQNFRYSTGLRRRFLECRADVAHLHALWMHTSVILSAWRNRTGRPYVTTINGMLDPWALQNSRAKKRLVAALYERRCLERAACLHVNSAQELDSIRAFGLRNPACIIPNGVDIRPAPEGVAPPWAAHVPAGANVLFYLGRLHPKKNLGALLHAWNAAAPAAAAQNWHLVIAGWDQLGHGVELQALAARLALPRVAFIGPQFGDAKAAALHRATATILPSLSEGLPMVVLEAWAASRPVLMTPQCNLLEGFAAGAALQIATGAEEMAAGLERLFTTAPDELQRMGARGLELIRQRYTWPRVAAELRGVYQWLVSGGEVPPCVRMN